MSLNRMSNSILSESERIQLAETAYESFLLQIDATYYLEKFDPHHRPSQQGYRLQQQFSHNLTIWQIMHKTDTTITAEFKKFLEISKPGNNTPQITYLDAESSKQYQVHFINKEMKFGNHNTISSESFKGKQPHYGAYVLNKEGRMFFNEHKKGEFHHSSFTSGDSVLCAGMIKIKAGKVKILNNNSGHYKPQESHLALLVYLLQCQEVLNTDHLLSRKNGIAKKTLALLTALHLRSSTPQVKVMYRSVWLQKVAHYLQDTSFRPLYWLGRLLDEQRFTKTYSLDAFDKKISAHYRENEGFREAMQRINQTHNISEEKQKKILGNNLSFFSHPPQPSQTTASTEEENDCTPPNLASSAR